MLQRNYVKHTHTIKKPKSVQNGLKADTSHHFFFLRKFLLTKHMGFPTIETLEKMYRVLRKRNVTFLIKYVHICFLFRT